MEVGVSVARAKNCSVNDFWLSFDTEINKNQSNGYLLIFLPYPYHTVLWDLDGCQLSNFRVVQSNFLPRETRAKDLGFFGEQGTFFVLVEISLCLLIRWDLFDIVFPAVVKFNYLLFCLFARRSKSLNFSISMEGREILKNDEAIGEWFFR